MSDAASTWLFSRLIEVRPAQLGAAIKTVLHIQRRVVRTIHGPAFWIDPVSVFGLSLIRTGSYEPELTRLVQALVGPGDVFVDVGANEGYFSILAAALVGGGSVHAIEPQSRVQAVIRRNVELNHASAVTIHRVALSDRAGEIDLFLRPSSNTGASSLFRHWRLGWTRERVPTTTLDALCGRAGIDRVRLVKIDCEGAERLVIRGAAALLARRAIDVLVVDYHEQIAGADACRETHQAIVDSGYALTRASGLAVYHRPELRATFEQANA